MIERLHQLLPALIELRRTLHRNPELAFQEENTARILANWFRQFPPDRIVEHLGGHGFACVFEGRQTGKTILFRSELDAVAVEEVNAIAYRSCRANVSHTCGHDGHIGILAGLGALLHQQRPASGRVILLFQPAEETGEGAQRIVADERFTALRPDVVFALHNLPGYPLGEVVMRHGTFNCASVGMRSTLSGKTSHAAHPEDGISPVPAVSAILQELSQIPSSNALQAFFSLVTITHVRIGDITFGVAPGEAELLATLRAETDDTLRRVMDAAERLVKKHAQTHGLSVQIAWAEYFRANVIHPDASALLERACAVLHYPVRTMSSVFRWSDDFSELTTRYPGAMFGLGAGEEHPQFHNPDYDFPESLLEIGICLFWQMAQCLERQENA